MVARANKIAEDSRTEILADAKEQADKVATRAREEITAEKEKAMAELRSTVADLALQAAGRLVRSEMDAPTQRRLVEDFLKEVKAPTGEGASATSRAKGESN
jgi:F-type H+-transporting ATPase subunit b